MIFPADRIMTPFYTYILVFRLFICDFSEFTFFAGSGYLLSRVQGIFPLRVNGGFVEFPKFSGNCYARWGWKYLRSHSWFIYAGCISGVETFRSWSMTVRGACPVPKTGRIGRCVFSGPFYDWSGEEKTYGKGNIPSSYFGMGVRIGRCSDQPGGSKSLEKDAWKGGWNLPCSISAVGKPVRKELFEEVDKLTAHRSRSSK